MIDFGVNKIPEAHILKRWTRSARDYQYPDESQHNSRRTVRTKLAVC